MVGFRKRCFLGKDFFLNRTALQIQSTTNSIIFFARAEVDPSCSPLRGHVLILESCYRPGGCDIYRRGGGGRLTFLQGLEGILKQFKICFLKKETITHNSGKTIAIESCIHIFAQPYMANFKITLHSGEGAWSLLIYYGVVENLTAPFTLKIQQCQAKSSCAKTDKRN